MIRACFEVAWERCLAMKASWSWVFVLQCIWPWLNCVLLLRSRITHFSEISALSTVCVFSPPVSIVSTPFAKVWHPNISSQNGAIDFTMLGDSWNAAITLKTALMMLQALLSTPDPDESCWDGLVAKQYKTSYDEFCSTAKHWTEAYASPVRTAPDEKVDVLIAMGFVRQAVVAALQGSGGDEIAALEILLGAWSLICWFAIQLYSRGRIEAGVPRWNHSIFVAFNLRTQNTLLKEGYRSGCYYSIIRDQISCFVSGPNLAEQKFKWMPRQLSIRSGCDILDCLRVFSHGTWCVIYCFQMIVW